MDITTKFSKNDIAYYNIFATATIYPVRVVKVYMRNATVYYDLLRQDSDFLLEGAIESEVFTFIEAKANLKAYLIAKLADVDAMVAPQ